MADCIKTINKIGEIQVIEVDLIQKEFNDLKKALDRNNYTASELDDLVFNFLMHCRKSISMIRDFPGQFKNIERIREIESKAMEMWPTTKLDEEKEIKYERRNPFRKIVQYICRNISSIRHSIFFN